MAEPNTPPPDAWNEGDAARLREYLQNNPRFVAELERHYPPRATTETLEAQALGYARRDGAQHLLEALKNLARHQDTAEATPFIE